MLLHVHTLIQWQDEATHAHVERVLCLDIRRDQVMMIDVDDSHALPHLDVLSDLEKAMAEGDAIVLDRDPHLALRQPDAELERRYGPAPWEKHRQRRDARWMVIEPIITVLEGQFFDSRRLGPLVQEAQERTRISKTHIYQFLRWYWQRGECRNALLPRYDRCGARGQPRKQHGRKRGRPRVATLIGDAAPGINVDDRVKAYFRRGTKLFYNTRKKWPLSKAFQEIEKRFFNVGYEHRDGFRVPVLAPSEQRPTLGQYRYWFQTEWEPVRTGVAREGLRRFNLRRRAVLGEYRASLGSLGPGSLYQIDATVADVFLVSELERQIIGRPVLYLVTDVFSTLITGYIVALEGPSWVGAMLALENMTLDKVAFCSEYGIAIDAQEWPSHHIPRRLCGDRAEMLSKCSDKLSAAFNITVSNTAAYRPDWKGRIEREFRLLNDGCIRWIPGHTNGWHERGERDCRLDASMSLREFTAYLADFIVEFNTLHQVADEYLMPAMIRDGVEPFPADLWHWGVENLSGALRTEPRGVVQRNLLPDATASVMRDGIRFCGLHYMCERARHEQWIERVRVRGTWRVPILYDPRTPKHIYLLPDGYSDPEPCGLEARDARFEACAWADIEDYYARRLTESQEREERTRQTRIEHEARRDAWIVEAERKTSEARDARGGPESKAARLRGVRERRQAERETDRAQKAWTLGLDVAPGEQEMQEHSEAVTEDEASMEAAYEANVLALLRQSDIGEGALSDMEAADSVGHERQHLGPEENSHGHP